MAEVVQIVPNQEVLTGGIGVVGDFFLKPLPQTPLFQDTVRLAPYPVLYENINPSMAITVQAVGGCPSPALPNLITSVSLFPGTALGNSGTKNEVISLVEIADKAVPNIAEFSSSNWFEPRMSYGSISGPPSPTMTLVAPLRGYYGEKYWYDADYIYASYYANTPDFTGSFYDEIGKGLVPEVNRLTHISLLGGRRILPFDDIPEGITQIEPEYFPAGGIPINLEQLATDTESEALTEGSDYLASFIPEISSWVKWKPSFIKIMRYNYILVVTHTCPPFVTILKGSMFVENNWTPAANRLSYYIDRQVGFLDTPDGEFPIPEFPKIGV